MTETAESAAPERDTIWPLFGWLIFTLSAAGLFIALLLGRVMRAVILDVISFWPAWAGAAVIALALWPLHRRGVARVGAIAPLLLFSWLTGAVGLHYSGWAQLPSSAGDLVGPEVGEADTAELRLASTGTVVVLPGSDRLYRVELARRGGTTGPAEALERRTDTAVVVELMERADGGWFESAGWNVSISRLPAWSLAITAPTLRADLATVVLESLEIVADGEVRVSSPVFGEVPIIVNGGVTLLVPDGTPVEVIGDADVPGTWEPIDGGWRSTGEGTARYVVTVVPGASLVIEHW